MTNFKKTSLAMLFALLSVGAFILASAQLESWIM